MIIRKPFAHGDFSYYEIAIVVDLFLVQKGWISDNIGKYFKQTKGNIRLSKCKVKICFHFTGD